MLQETTVQCMMQSSKVTVTRDSPEWEVPLKSKAINKVSMINYTWDIF